MLTFRALVFVHWHQLTPTEESFFEACGIGSPSKVVKDLALVDLSRMECVMQRFLKALQEEKTGDSRITSQWHLLLSGLLRVRPRLFRLDLTGSMAGLVSMA